MYYFIYVYKIMGHCCFDQQSLEDEENFDIDPNVQETKSMKWTNHTPLTYLTVSSGFNSHRLDLATLICTSCAESINVKDPLVTTNLVRRIISDKSKGSRDLKVLQAMNLLIGRVWMEIDMINGEHTYQERGWFILDTIRGLTGV